MYRAPIIAMAVAAAALPGSAEAATVVFSGSMTGTSSSVPAPPECAPLLRLSTLVGSGSSSLGSFDYQHDVCLSGIGSIHGTFALDFLTGDTLSGTLEGAATTTAITNLNNINFIYTILAGTGQYLGATGQFAGSGTVDQRTPGITQVAINFAAVPEPATWAMMLFGFGAVGSVMRFRPKARFSKA